MMRSRHPSLATARLIARNGILVGVLAGALASCGDDGGMIGVTESTVSGTVSYAGSMQGTLRFGLYSDQEAATLPFAQGVAIEQPTFPQAYEIKTSIPGSYFVKAFLDITGDNPQGTQSGDDIVAISPQITIVEGDQQTVDLTLQDP